MEVQNEIDHSMYQGCRGIFWALIACVFLFSLLAYHSCSGQTFKDQLLYIQRKYKVSMVWSRSRLDMDRPTELDLRKDTSAIQSLCRILKGRDDVELKFTYDTHYVIKQYKGDEAQNLKICDCYNVSPVIITTNRKPRVKKKGPILPPPDDMLNTKITIYDR